MLVPTCLLPPLCREETSWAGATGPEEAAAEHHRTQYASASPAQSAEAQSHQKDVDKALGTKMANQRTAMASVRTANSLVMTGAASLYLAASDSDEGGWPDSAERQLAAVAGILVLISGVVIILLGVRNYSRTLETLNSKKPRSASRQTRFTVMSTALAATAAAVAFMAATRVLVFFV